MAFLKLIPLKAWIASGIVALLLAGFGAYKYQKARADRAEADLAPAVATVGALDKVATETPIIRQEQAEREREVEKIPGSDQRLPDGFGADLERVRRGGSDKDSR